MNQLISKSVSQLEGLLERSLGSPLKFSHWSLVRAVKNCHLSLVIGHWESLKERSLVSEGMVIQRRLKASKYGLHANFNTLYDYRHFDAFTVGSIHSKKPSGGPKGLIGPPCHGAEGKKN